MRSDGLAIVILLCVVAVYAYTTSILIIKPSDTLEPYNIKKEEILVDIEKNLYHYNVSDVEVKDGDTLKCTVDLGDEVTRPNRDIRINGINAPEKTGSEKFAGQAVKDYVTMLLKDKRVIIVSHQKPDKYGRWLCDVFFKEGDLYISLAERLITEQLCRSYDGGTKQPYTSIDCTKIIEKVSKLLEAKNK